MKTRPIALTVALVLGVGVAGGAAQLGKIKKQAERIADEVVNTSKDAVNSAVARDDATYGVDGEHSSVLFKIKHAGTSNFWGRFDDLDGTWSFDPASPESASFSFVVRTSKINTGSRKRDKHLKSIDFFNTKQYPRMRFDSTSITRGEGGMFQMDGELTLVGETRPISAQLEYLGTGNYNGPIAAFEATFTVSRSEFGMSGFEGGVGDEVSVIISVEGPRQ